MWEKWIPVISYFPFNCCLTKICVYLTLDKKSRRVYLSFFFFFLLIFHFWPQQNPNLLFITNFINTCVNEHELFLNIVGDPSFIFITGIMINVIWGTCITFAVVLMMNIVSFKLQRLYYFTRVTCLQGLSSMLEKMYGKS